MNVLALVTGGFGAHGGIAQFNRDFLAALAASPLTDRIVVLPREGAAVQKPEGEPEGLPPAIRRKIQEIRPAAGRAACSFAALRLALVHGPFGAIFCGHLFMAPLAALLAQLAGARLWLHLHGIEAWRPPGRAATAAAGRADLVTAVSRHTRSRFLSWAGVEDSRVRVLPNTVAGRFSPGPWPAALAARYGLAGCKVLLTVSRLAASEGYKGHDRVIAALPAVRARHPDVVYAVAGGGDDLPRLERLARETGVENAIRFLGHVPGRDLPDLYRLARVFVMPSTGEGFGIAFLEAAATGLPIVAGNCAGSPDALADGALGILADPLDGAALARAIMTAIENPCVPDPAAAARFSRQNFERHTDDLLRILR